VFVPGNHFPVYSNLCWKHQELTQEGSIWKVLQLGWLWPCLQILRPDWKGFPRSTPLAYWASLSVTKKKSLMTLTPEVVDGVGQRALAGDVGIASAGALVRKKGKINSSGQLNLQGPWCYLMFAWQETLGIGLRRFYRHLCLGQPLVSQAERYLTAENLTVIWAEFSTLSLSHICKYCMVSDTPHPIGLKTQPRFHPVSSFVHESA
jgi:hypothetical protein